MMTEQKSRGHWTMESRQEDLAEIFEQIDGEDTDAFDEAYEQLDQFGLGLSVKKMVTITLSTGGPHDELVVVMDGREVESVTYRFYDWFGEDLYERRLLEDDPLYRYAEREVEHLEG